MEVRGASSGCLCPEGTPKSTERGLLGDDVSPVHDPPLWLGAALVDRDSGTEPDSHLDQVQEVTLCPAPEPGATRFEEGLGP